MQPQLQKQISTRIVFGGKTKVLELVLANKKTNNFLYRVWGNAMGFVEGTSKNFKREDGSDSTWKALAGEFEAVNADGEMFSAPICFLPAYVTNPIIERLKDDGVESYGFAFDVFAQFDEKSATSYIYLVQPLNTTGAQSIVERQRGAISRLPLPGGKKMPALEAPKDAVEGAQEESKGGKKK